MARTKYRVIVTLSAREVEIGPIVILFIGPIKGWYKKRYDRIFSPSPSFIKNLDFTSINETIKSYREDCLDPIKNGLKKTNFYIRFSVNPNRTENISFRKVFGSKLLETVLRNNKVYLLGGVRLECETMLGNCRAIGEFEAYLDLEEIIAAKKSTKAIAAVSNESVINQLII